MQHIVILKNYVTVVKKKIDKKKRKKKKEKKKEYVRFDGRDKKTKIYYIRTTHCETSRCCTK